MGSRLIDLTGLRFGCLLVKRVDKIKSSTVTKQKMAWAYWRCICEPCGVMTSVRSDHLRNGAIRMCDQCSYEKRQNKYARLRELRRQIDPEKYAKEPKNKRLRRSVVDNPGQGVVINIAAPFHSRKSISKAGPLRDSGCSIIDIMDLLGQTREDVMAEIKRYRKEGVKEEKRVIKLAPREGSEDDVIKGIVGAERARTLRTFKKLK